MVRLFPFEGLFFNIKKVKNLSKVTTPPYDVISPEQQEELYNLHDFNYVRLILGKEFPGDGEFNNRHVRAAGLLDGWIRHKILLKDDKPAFYVYEQVFSAQGKKYSRLGFIGLLRLEEFGRGKVFPHEETYPKAKLDRLQLMRATNANLESIFAFYSDEKEKINKIFKPYIRKKPLLEAKDKEGVVSRVWRIDRRPSIAKIMQEMKDKAVFIADGHHRYEAALRFRNELKQRNTKFTEEEAYNHIMVFFTPLEDKGLVVFPFHRVISDLTFFDPTKMEQDLSQYFEITPYPANSRNAPLVRKKLLKDMEKASALGKHVFGLYLGHNRYSLLTLKEDNVIDDLVVEEKSKAWKRLDATILHYTVFDHILNIAQTTESKVAYTKDAEEAVKMVDGKGANLAFFLNPTKIEEIVAIASKLEKLPHKSTYFYPKLLSGLIINKFGPNDKIVL